MIGLSLKCAQASNWPSFSSSILASFEKIRLFSEGLRHGVSDRKSIYVSCFCCITLECYVQNNMVSLPWE